MLYCSLNDAPQLRRALSPSLGVSLCPRQLVPTPSKLQLARHTSPVSFHAFTKCPLRNRASGKMRVLPAPALPGSGYRELIVQSDPVGKDLSGTAHYSSSRPFLCFHTVANCPFSISFVLKFMHRMGGVRGRFQSSLLTSNFQPLTPVFSQSSALFCTYLHFLALCKKSSPFLSCNSALFRRNTGGWGEAGCAPNFSSSLKSRIPNSCICHSYENNRGVAQLFPSWSPAPCGIVTSLLPYFITSSFLSLQSHFL
jgi:hypothetical protein